MQICEKLPDSCAAETFSVVAPDAKMKQEESVNPNPLLNSKEREREPIPAAISCAGAASVPGYTNEGKATLCVWVTLTL